VAQRIAAVPRELVQLNKRVVHRQMDHMGLRTGIRAGTELCALGTHTRAMAEFTGNIAQKGLTGALQERDEKFGDYRTTTK
jgi:enoyl-CoA hydratase